MVKILTAFALDLVAIYASVVFGPLNARSKIGFSSHSPFLTSVLRFVLLLAFHCTDDAR